MEPGSTTRVWKNGRFQDAGSDAALSSLCHAVERALKQHQSAGVRAVILMVEEPATRPEPAVTPVPVYVDVFESGYGHGI